MIIVIYSCSIQKEDIIRDFSNKVGSLRINNLLEIKNYLNTAKSFEIKDLLESRNYLNDIKLLGIEDLEKFKYYLKNTELFEIEYLDEFKNHLNKTNIKSFKFEDFKNFKNNLNNIKLLKIENLLFKKKELPEILPKIDILFEIENYMRNNSVCTNKILKEIHTKSCEVLKDCSFREYEVLKDISNIALTKYNEYNYIYNILIENLKLKQDKEIEIYNEFLDRFKKESEKIIQEINKLYQANSKPISENYRQEKTDLECTLEDYEDLDKFMQKAIKECEDFKSKIKEIEIDNEKESKEMVKKDYENSKIIEIISKDYENLKKCIQNKIKICNYYISKIELYEKKDFIKSLELEKDKEIEIHNNSLSKLKEISEEIKRSYA